MFVGGCVGCVLCLVLVRGCAVVSGRLVPLVALLAGCGLVGSVVCGLVGSCWRVVWSVGRAVVWLLVGGVWCRGWSGVLLLGWSVVGSVLVWFLVLLGLTHVGPSNEVHCKLAATSMAVVIFN